MRMRIIPNEPRLAPSAQEKRPCRQLVGRGAQEGQREMVQLLASLREGG